MDISLRLLGETDIETHNAAEDAAIVRWLTGEKGSEESTRRRGGVATRAVSLMCDYIRDHHLGDQAALRIEPDNVASLGVADRAGFRFAREFVSATDTELDGTPARMRLYLRDL